MLKKIRDIVLILTGLGVLLVILNIGYCAKKVGDEGKKRTSMTREERIREDQRQAKKLAEDILKDQEIRMKIREEQKRR